MNKRSVTVLIFIVILIVMFALLPKSCGESPAQPQNAVLANFKL